jgi:hypothetical protein
MLKLGDLLNLVKYPSLTENLLIFMEIVSTRLLWIVL